MITEAPRGFNGPDTSLSVGENAARLGKDGTIRRDREVVTYILYVLPIGHERGRISWIGRTSTRHRLHESRRIFYFFKFPFNLFPRIFLWNFSAFYKCKVNRSIVRRLPFKEASLKKYDST